MFGRLTSLQGAEHVGDLTSLLDQLPVYASKYSFSLWGQTSLQGAEHGGDLTSLLDQPPGEREKSLENVAGNAGNGGKRRETR